ncbi:MULTISPECIES: hypothetical protein [Flavobacteriaceae]|uniref:hypothetical protein n=1 Tax=Flavobacteriaceae TaxID=49546 RepID=UPI0014926191|nr:MULTISPECIES: hypothetical protein [Allomuricauda]MDC6364970.1 hypothetical protein [Muricauda sp. AC10]
MRKISITLIAGSFLFLISCSKNSDSDDDGFVGTVEEKSFTIRNTETITYYLGDLGESGFANITVQAKNYSISKVERGNYLYEPKEDFVGEDYVEVTSTNRSKDTNGNDVSRNTKTKITIEVTP